MPVTCLLSHTYHDLRCPVCGEGFLILDKVHSMALRKQVRRTVGDALRAQHTHLGATDVHSAEPFHVATDHCGPVEWLHPSVAFHADAGIYAA